MSLRPLFPLLLASCLSVTALAQERRYNVEIVILEHTDTGAGEIERWRPQVVVPEIEGAVVLEGPVELAPMVRAEGLAEAPAGFEPLPSEQRRLGGAIRELQASGSYRVLRHLAWQQPALGDEEAPRIRVHNGEAITVRVPIRDFSELYALEDEAETGTDTGSMAVDPAASDPGAAGTGTADEDEAGRATMTFGADRTRLPGVQPLLRPVEVHPLDGTVRLVVSRYLHIYTDLYLTSPVEWTDLTAAGSSEDAAEEAVAEERDAGEPPGDEDADADGGRTRTIARGPDGQAMLSYPFRQHRRMRSGELHYLDHPVLGLLIRVDRAEDEGPEAGGSP